MTYDYLPLFIPIKNTTVRKLLIKDIYNTEIFNSISCTLYLSIHLHLSIYIYLSPYLYNETVGKVSNTATSKILIYKT